MQITIQHLKDFVGQEVTLKGWAYNFRSSGKIYFLQLRDGSGFVQIVFSAAELAPEMWEALKSVTLESSVEVRGIVKTEPRAQGGFEIQGTAFIAIHINKEEYPIGKKEHGPEFLFDNRDLYLRSQTPWAVLRIRDRVFFSIEQFFHEENFVRFDTPVLQPTSCEDTTQLFTVDYYGTPMYLSQSGQLYSEAGIMGFGKVYDFGPVFRAEKSKTRHHLSELWMMDAEMAFYDQDMNMDVQEKMVKRIVADVLRDCQPELKILGRDTTLLQRLVKEDFVRITHRKAKELMIELYSQGVGAQVNASELADVIDEYSKDDVDIYGDMSTAEEIYLGNHFGLPIFITDYPAEVKAFYMKRWTDESGPKPIERACCADLIAPEGGREIIGGSQRNESYDELRKEIIDRDYPLEEYEWYLNTRKFGSVPHSGFGIGLERTVRWITGVHHIRETIPFARMLNRNRP